MAVEFDRPDAGGIEIIRDQVGRIVHARLPDNSPLAYLLKLGLADHGHEAAVNTYLDWQQAYQATRGFKISNYGTRLNSGGSDDDKAGKYLKLIRLLGRSRQIGVEQTLDMNATLGTQVMFEFRFTFLSHLDALSRTIKTLRDEKTACAHP